MPACAVASCTTHSRKTKGTNIAYHSFPRDPILRKIWVVRCCRKDSFKLETARICSKHFKPDDYLRDLKAELLVLPPKKLLKPDAVPTVNLPYGKVREKALNLKESVCASPLSSSDNLETSSALDKPSRHHAQNTQKHPLIPLDSLSPKRTKLDKAVETESHRVFASDYVEEMHKCIMELEQEVRRLKSQCTKLLVQNVCLKRTLVATRRKLNKL